MICSDPRCTGSHDDRNYATLCPRTREVKRERRRQYDRDHPDRARERSAIYRTTAAYMVAQAKYEARRRGTRG